MAEEEHNHIYYEHQTEAIATTVSVETLIEFRNKLFKENKLLKRELEETKKKSFALEQQSSEILQKHSQLEQLVNQNTLYAKYQETITENEQLGKSVKEFQNQISSNENQNNLMKDTLKKLENDNNEYQTKISEMTKQINEANTQIKSKQTEIQQLSENIKKFENDCHDQLTIIENMKTELNNLTDEKNQFNEIKHELQSNIDQLKQKIEELQNQIKINKEEQIPKKLETETDDLQIKLQNLESELLKKQQENEKLNENLKEQQNIINEQQQKVVQLKTVSQHEFVNVEENAQLQQTIHQQEKEILNQNKEMEEIITKIKQLDEIIIEQKNKIEQQEQIITKLTKEQIKENNDQIEEQDKEQNESPSLIPEPFKQQQQEELELPFLSHYILTNMKLSDINDRWTFQSENQEESLLEKNFSNMVSIIGNKQSGKNYVLNLIKNYEILNNDAKQYFVHQSELQQNQKEHMLRLYFESEICFATQTFNIIQNQDSEESQDKNALAHYLFQFLTITSQIIIYVVQGISTFEINLIQKLQSQFPGKMIIILYNIQAPTKKQALNYFSSVIEKFFQLTQIQNSENSLIFSQPTTPFYHLLILNQGSEESYLINSAASKFIQFLLSQLSSEGDANFFTLFQDHFTNEFISYVEPKSINNSLTLNQENELFFEEKNEIYKIVDDDYNFLRKKKIEDLIFKKCTNYSYVIKKISSEQVMLYLMFSDNQSEYKLSHIQNESNGKSTIVKLELYCDDQDEEIQIELENYPNIDQNAIQEYRNAFEIIFNIII